MFYPGRIKILGLLPYFLLTVGVVSLAGEGAGERTIEVGGRSLVYREYLKSLPGNFLFSLYDAAPIFNRSTPTKTALAVLGSDGKLVYQRSFESRFQPIVIGDFKKTEPGLYGFLIGAEEGLQWESTCHFMDSRFREVFPRAVPNDDRELDEHELLRMRNGDYLFVFYRDRIQDAVIDAEIQERDAKGKMVFSWNSNGRLAPPADAVSTMDYLHLNSIDEDSDGGLLLSFAETSEIVKLSHPGGKVLWRMSYRDWTFANDTQRGFRHQHTVRRLANGDLLLFDNGGHGREEFSRAVEYRVNEAAKTATLVWEYRAKKGNPFRSTGGSVQRLSNGNTVIGWGGVAKEYAYAKGQLLPLFTEVDPAGNTVRELMARDDEVSYRVSFDENGGK